MAKRIKISGFTKPELDILKEECNFTPEELEFFNYRSRGESITEIMFKMHFRESKANSVSNRISQKIALIYSLGIMDKRLEEMKTK